MHVQDQCEDSFRPFISAFNMHNTLKSITPKREDKFSSEFLDFIYNYRGLFQGFNDFVFMQQIVSESQNLYTETRRM